MEIRGADPAGIFFQHECGVAAVGSRPGWVLGECSPDKGAWPGQPLSRCGVARGAEEGPGQADGEKGFFPRAGLDSRGFAGWLAVLPSGRSGREALVCAAVLPPTWGRVWVIPACHIPIPSHFLQAGVREAGLRACLHANAWGATEPITCMFTRLREVLWCFGKGFLGAKHPPRVDSALQQGEACSGLRSVAALSPCTDTSRVPADEREAAAFVSCLSQCPAKGRSPFPAFSLPEPAYFGCACPILQGSLALLPRSPRWDLAAALASPARAEGPIGLPIKVISSVSRRAPGCALGRTNAPIASLGSAGRDMSVLLF